jgi:hypothetical protein
MIIKFSPQLRSDTLTLSKNGDIFTINGEEIDFEPLESGTKLPLEVCQSYSPYLISAQRNADSILELTILLPHTSDSSEAARHPQPVVNPSNGQIQIPT